MLYTIIIPVFNEENTILQLINQVKKLNSVLNIEIIAIDDGSTDKTSEILKKIKGIKKIIFKNNRGKGFAIKEGIKNAKGNYIIIQDADLEYDPIQIPSLIEKIENQLCEVVFGSRFIGQIHGTRIPLHDLGNKVLSIMFSFLFGTKLTDMQTCYKIIPKKFFDQTKLESNRFDIDTEITIKLVKAGYRIKEFPISYHSRTRLEGKKINIIDGFIFAYKILKYRFLD